MERRPTRRRYTAVPCAPPDQPLPAVNSRETPAPGRGRIDASRTRRAASPHGIEPDDRRRRPRARAPVGMVVARPVHPPADRDRRARSRSRRGRRRRRLRGQARADGYARDRRQHRIDRTVPVGTSARGCIRPHRAADRHGPRRDRRRGPLPHHRTRLLGDHRPRRRGVDRPRVQRLARGVLRRLARPAARRGDGAVPVTHRVGARTAAGP